MPLPETALCFKNSAFDKVFGIITDYQKNQVIQVRRNT